MTDEKKKGFNISDFMPKEESKGRLIMPCIVIFLIVLADQILKIWVKTHMQIGDSIPIFGNWFQIYFVENEGMAFGMAFGGNGGKLVLTSFRILASIAMVFGLMYMANNKARTITILSVALIYAGAVGNIIDSCFYGVLFNESFYQVAEFMPQSGGYASFMHGRVVDMFYFPIIDTVLPEWMPLVGGKNFTFFNAIFNIADSAITVGVAMLIIDQIIAEKKRKAEVAGNVEQ